MVPATKVRARFGIVAPLFLLSGGTALLYQVAFGKQLATIFGATAYAVSAVLAAFMGGLALGAYLGGRQAPRARRPLFVYGVAEIVVGVVCALTPWLFEAVAAVYLALLERLPGSLATVSAIRAAVTAAVVLVPTIAMGVTLPMLARAVAADAHAAERSRRRLGVLYALNTAGGALGALASAYLVLPALGIAHTMRAAAAVNAAIGLVAVGVGRRGPVVPVSDAAPAAPGPTLGTPIGPCSPARPRDGGLMLVLAAGSGLLVFAAEVVDTHLLTLLIGNSAYAFGLMLAVFLGCLSAGAALAGPVDRALGAAALPVAMGATAASLLGSLLIWGRLPLVLLAAGPVVFSWQGRELVRAAVAFAALVVPTTSMGLTYPLLLRRAAGRPDVGQRVGQLTAVNTLGSIVGSLGCGYLVLPAFGSEQSLRLVAAAFAAGAVLAAWWLGRRSAPARRAAATGLVATAGLLATLPSWDMKVMTNGANVYFDVQPAPDEIVFVAEDVHGGLTSVARRGPVLTLYTNGKFQGDDGAEVTAQQSFAHFPSMFVPRFRRALVIGLGTGTTLGTIAAYPYEAIDVAEISPAIVQAARRYFAGPNRGALADPRVRLVLNDGRNALLLSRERYDLITIELTSVWFAGAANLYSHEFYELCRKRLGDTGVLQQWVQLHHIDRREIGVLLRTLRRSFAEVAVFVSGGQGIVVASQAPLVASRARLTELSRRPAVQATLGGATDLAVLVERLLLSGPELDRFVAESSGAADALVSTDDNLYLEHATPKGNVMSYGRSLAAMVAELGRYRVRAPARRHLRP